MYLISSVLKRGLPQSIAITNYSRALSDAQCSLNFIRLLRVVVTPSLTSESTGRQCRPVTSLDGIDDRSIQTLVRELRRLEVIGWNSGYTGHHLVRDCNWWWQWIEVNPSSTQRRLSTYCMNWKPGKDIYSNIFPTGWFPRRPRRCHLHLSGQTFKRCP